ncbi:MAG: type II secretion system protein GspD [Acidobacteriaceae bacterium]
MRHVWSKTARRRATATLALLLCIDCLALPAQQSSAAAAATAPSDAGSTSSSNAAAARATPSAKDKRTADKLYLRGARAIQDKDLRAAARDFDQAAQLVPGNADYAAAAAIARAHLVTELVQQADKARILGQDDIARARLAEGLALDPKNPIVTQHIDDLANLSLAAPATDDPTAQIAEAIQLAPRAGKQSFHLRADGKSLLQQVLAAYGITPTLDSSVAAPALRFDAEEITFDQAAALLKLQTNTFFVPLDPRRVLVAKDTKENRDKYQRQLLETVYLPGLNATEMSDMGNLARNIFDAQQATVQPGRGTLTIRAPEARLAALNRSLADLLDGRSQLLLEVRLFEVAKTRTTNIGVQAPQQFTAFNVPTELNTVVNGNQDLINQIVSSGLASAGDTAAIVAILIASGQVTGSILNQPFATFGGGSTLTGLTLGTTTANLALNASESRALDHVQIRLQDQETATLMSGTRYPIIQSSYSSLSPTTPNIPGLNTAGLSSQLAALGLSASSLQEQPPIPQVQYEDLGLTLKATPHIQRNDRVALKLDLKLQALAGGSLNGVPELTNRQFTTDVDVLDGESTMVTSSLTSSEAKAVSGIPGLSEIPGFQSTTDRNDNLSQDSLIILITPHIVRQRHTQVAGPVILLPQH